MRSEALMLVAGFASALLASLTGIDPRVFAVYSAAALLLVTPLHEIMHLVAARLLGVKLASLQFSLRPLRLGFPVLNASRKGLIIAALAPQILTAVFMAASLVHPPLLAFALVNIAGSIGDYRVALAAARGESLLAVSDGLIQGRCVAVPGPRRVDPATGADAPG